MLYNAIEPPSDTTNLAEALRSAVGRFVRTTRSRAGTPPSSQAETLRRLEREGPQTMADLARYRGVSHQAVSRAVGELERLRLVERAPNPADARGYVLTLSADGRAAVEADRASRADAIARAIATGLSPSERRALTRVPALLDALSDALARDS
jgi:DNA-binding MarR family transcriptional regulator